MRGHPAYANQQRVLELAVDNKQPLTFFKQDECLSWTDNFMDQLPVISVEQAKESGWTLMTDVVGPPNEIREVLHHALLIAGTAHKDLGVTKGASGGILVWIRPSTDAPAAGEA